MRVQQVKELLKVVPGLYFNMILNKSKKMYFQRTWGCRQEFFEFENSMEESRGCNICGTTENMKRVHQNNEKQIYKK